MALNVNILCSLLWLHCKLTVGFFAGFGFFPQTPAAVSELEAAQLPGMTFEVSFVSLTP